MTIFTGETNFKPKIGDIVFLHDMIEPNGKTIKENNLKLKHNIPIGSLVEVTYTTWLGDGACEKVQARLWVVSHSRDCDGTPLYILSQLPDYELSRRFYYLRCGFSEEQLSVIEVTQDIMDGVGALE